jgi:Na+-transporting NADH:ubiquinone oxidoreductase subunit NqrC
MRIFTYVLAGVLAAAVLLSGAVVAVNADDGQKVDGIRPVGKILDRVAQILNIDKQKLIDAFKQAVGELRQEGLTDRLDKWVADGQLTQDEANQYKSWLASKPAGVVIAPQVMGALLKNGKITQAQWDEWKRWFDTKPDIKLPKADKPNPNRGLLQRPGRLQPGGAQGNFN